MTRVARSSGMHPSHSVPSPVGAKRSNPSPIGRRRGVEVCGVWRCVEVCGGVWRCVEVSVEGWCEGGRCVEVCGGLV